MSARAAYRLLTFAPMIDSETARLLCRWYGTDYDERDHLFGWVSLLTLLHGGYGRAPLLYGDGTSLSGPREMVERFDRRAPPARRLLLAVTQAAGVEADWDAYNGSLASDVAVFTYFHLLPERALMTPVFAARVPPTEARLTPMLYPALRGLLSRLLRLRQSRADAAERRIQTMFGAVDRRLGDGRPFLTGARLTLGDIAFAAAAAPLLQPTGFTAPIPPLAAMPAAVRQLTERLEASRAAALVARVYAAIDSDPASTGSSL
uniref:glutathione S-transferase C-terminal domain-containing protein n=1 Tax=uncultured Sphingomonas sp. TaxID=158754 RepID=UPI0035C9BCDB